jgi:hypothetical protein
VGGIHAIQATHVMPPGGHNWSYVVFLDTSPCPLSFGVARCNLQ